MFKEDPKTGSCFLILSFWLAPQPLPAPCELLCPCCPTRGVGMVLQGPAGETRSWLDTSSFGSRALGGNLMATLLHRSSGAGISLFCFVFPYFLITETGKQHEVRGEAAPSFPYTLPHFHPSQGAGALASGTQSISFTSSLYLLPCLDTA